MNSTNKLNHEFVDFIPEQMQQGTLYISIQFAIASHLCFCGCGMEVVTPFTPTDWTLSFDGETVTLSPSIGNWSFPCQSHYWIKRNTVQWAVKWTQKQVQSGRERDSENKQQQFSSSKTMSVSAASVAPSADIAESDKRGILRRIMAWFGFCS